MVEVRKVDDLTVDFVTKDPFPILPDTINTWYIMSKAWCEKNNATEPVDVRKGKENAATLKANGTGPFMLKSREVGVRTVLVAILRGPRCARPPQDEAGVVDGQT